MYPNQETDWSFEYLKKVVSILEEPICLIGGWAIFFTVNKNYKANFGKDYLGSKDIDLGFHIGEKQVFEQSSFAKAMKKLEEEGFKEVGGRMVKELDYDTGKEISQEQAKAKPLFEVHKMYVDLMVDQIPKKFSFEKIGFMFDEELLKHVFEKNENREEMQEFSKKLWLPAPWVLLAMKTKSAPNRQKGDKRKKDLADMAALLLFKKQQDYALKLLEVLRKDKIFLCLKKIAPQEISETEQLLAIQLNSFNAALLEIIRQIEGTFKGKVRKMMANGKRVQIARSHSIAEIDNQIPGLKI